MKFLKRAAAIGVAISLALASSPSSAAGGKGSTTSNALLALILNATTFTSIAQNASSTPATVICAALHTASPGAGGTQSTNEAAYTGYGRVSMARTSSGFTVSGNSATFTSAINFPPSTGGTESETYFSLAVPTSGTTCAGALVILYFGPITPSIPVSAGITPQLTVGTTITEN
jgi:hypothetical protein